MSSSKTLHLYKQNFKFSSAHFLIFDEKNAEMLHGHNYQVKVDVKIPNGGDQETGFFVDFRVFKDFIKSVLDRFDEHVLLPAKHPDILTGVKGSSLELRFRERFYVFPKNEVHLLPIVNTSVECLSELLAQEFLSEFKKYGVKSLRVTVEETRGQAASTVLSTIQP